MPLDPIKTQVLILHSEQSALDDLSAGIDDRYTVHCATSGTEALNTLGETPIHVIISAQDLPGMSGVEALREAKKRSPETIGILLAGPDDKNIEALVGEKEVFQVVRGGISSDDLAQLVDNATRQMRLLALAESANDTAAAPEDTIAEHIVMETSENGSTIISDGTGQLPTLGPTKISAAQAVGSQAVDVLVLTKDEEFLATVKESSRGMHNVRCATTLAQAEEAIVKFKVGVAVVDAALVGSKVEKLTQHLSRRAARLVNIVAGRRDDGEMLMDLINRGKVYRFLLKPVSPGRARLAIEASVKHHLEAPDSAFKIGPPAAPASAPAKPAAKAKPEPAPQPAAEKPAAEKSAAEKSEKKAATKPAPKPEAAPRKAPEPVAPAAKESVDGPDSIHVTAEDGLSSPFDGGDSSFTETVTGIVGKLGKPFKSKDDADAPADEPPLSLEADAGDGGSVFGNPKVLGIGAAAAVAAIAGGLWFFLGSDAAPERPAAAPQTTAQPASTEPTEVPAAAPVPEQALSSGELLDEARLARDAGQIVYPNGGNALEMYAAAVAADPTDDVAAAELAAVVDEAFTLTETAILERSLDDAAAALDRIAVADPDNARLTFLSAQLEQMRVREYLDSARAAIRESRLEDAARALTAANALSVTDTSDLDAVAEELAAARSAQQIGGVLESAAASLAAGNLVAPANDNARYYYELALASDPDNAAARQGLTVIASKLVLQARAEIDRGRFGLAEGLLDEARVLDAESAEVEETTQALADARQQVAANQRRQEAARRAAEREEAERLAALQRAEEDRRAAAAALVAAQQAEAAAEPAPQEAAPPAADTAAAEPDAPPTMAQTMAPASEEFVARAAPAVAEPARTVNQAPVAISTLTRTKYVAPRYPRAAERRNQSGWVEVVFTVTTEGTTRDIEIRDSNPGNVFVDAATRAVEKWEFEPVIENGEFVEKRVGVRMMFALE